MLRVKDLQTEATKDEVVMEAIIVKVTPSGTWKDFGTVTTSDPKQMQGLYNWFATGNGLTEDEFFFGHRIMRDE